MSTDNDETPDRRFDAAGWFQAAGLVLVTSGMMIVDIAAGLVTAGAACLWIGWSQS